MSLDTLLEAAKYLEYKTRVKARGEEPYDYCTFSKLYSLNFDISGNSTQPLRSQRHVQSSPSHCPEEFRERRRTTSSGSRESILLQEHGGSGTREVHNKLEKNRRAHLKECFDALKKQLPNMDDRKTSNLSILRGAIRYIQTLKRKEREYEHDLERLAREKISFQQQLSTLKKDLSAQYEHIDVNAIIAVEDHESTTTASECGVSDEEDDPLIEPLGSNHNSRLSSEDNSIVSSSSVTTSRSTSNVASNSSTSQTLAFPKPGPVNTVFPSSLKGAPSKANVYNSESHVPVKVSGRPAVAEFHGTQTTSVDGAAKGQPSKIISSSNLQAMTGILSSPHAVQVITPPSNIKLLATSNSLPPATMQQLQVNNRPQGHIHVVTPSGVSYMSSAPTRILAASNSKMVGEAATSNSKAQPLSPVTLVPSQAFVGISHVTASGKSLVINQAPTYSELISTTCASTTLATNQFLMKQSQIFGTNMTFSVKNPLENGAPVVVTSPTAPKANGSTAGLGAKSGQALLQPSTAAQQNNSTFIPSEGLQVNHQVSIAPSRGQSIASPANNLLTPNSNLAHLVSQSPITVPASQLVPPGSHMSGVTPIMGSVSVVSHTGAVHHHQILAQSQSLGKVLGSPLLKSINQVNQIPLIPQQFLQAASSVSAQPMVKPVVVVSMPNIIHSTGISTLAARGPPEKHENCNSSTPGLKK